MENGAENRAAVQEMPGAGGPGWATPPGAEGTPARAGATPSPGGQALAVREAGVEEVPAEEELAELDERLQRLNMQVDVVLRVHSFRVQDLLSMQKGTVVETVHEHTQDVPVRCGGALLMWSEFEVLDQQLAVRVTRLA